MYYNIPRFVQEILEFVDDGKPLAPLEAKNDASTNNQQSSAKNQDIAAQPGGNPQDSAPVHDGEE